MNSVLKAGFKPIQIQHQVLSPDAAMILKPRLPVTFSYLGHTIRQ